MQPRFNPDCETFEQVVDYYKNRAIQLLRFGYRLDRIEEVVEHNLVRKLGVQDPGEPIAVKAIFSHVAELQDYVSFYLYPKHRGKGNFKLLVESEDLPVLTSDDCGLEDYLRAQGIVYKSVSFRDDWAYNMISEHYGAERAKRSGVYLMNHIDEGLAILEWIGATGYAKQAYCLHPIFQTDEDLQKVYTDRSFLTFPRFPNLYAVVLVMEYRNIANAYLSNRTIRHFAEIDLSPLPEVNDMLVADKVQNYKDFLLYHSETHPRSKELGRYFINWFDRLGIGSQEGNSMFDRLKIKPLISSGNDSSSSDDEADR